MTTFRSRKAISRSATTQVRKSGRKHQDSFVADIPRPRVKATTWRKATRHDIRDRSNLLLIWQDTERDARVFLIPHSAIPDAWADTLWLCHGSYLKQCREKDVNDTVTSMIRIVAVCVWPQTQRMPKFSRLDLLHTDHFYTPRDITRCWCKYAVPPSKQHRIDKSNVAMTVRTGRFSPLDPFDAFDEASLIED